jgi:DNA gyrase subunit A
MSEQLPQEFAHSVQDVTIESELKQAYLDYAMSVIVGRALPDVRDGLKPVHRRVLYAMHELHNYYNKPYKKSARIVGDVMGKYHPHGDSAIYDSIVRMAQPFAMSHTLIDGQGNFGSVDGDSAAAMRYTEIRMQKLAAQMLADLEKETVDFVPNYDNSESMPSVLPTKFPNLLINGSSGIAVGMATNIPPHNLTEVVKACLHLIDNPNATVDELMAHLPGPDFPTGGIIVGGSSIKEAYETGRGKVYVRAKCHFESEKSSTKQSIIVTEIPYQVNKARLSEKIAELVRDKKCEAISMIRDESDKDGMRLVIELKRGEEPSVVLNNLYRLTQLQVTFGINMVALDNSRPSCMSLHKMLEAFIDHRRVVVSRRSIFDLNKARNRLHVLEGLTVALSNIDAMIEMIKNAKSPNEAKQQLIDTKWPGGKVVKLLEGLDYTLCKLVDIDAKYGLHQNINYHLTPDQAQAILDLKLHRLTGLEQDKIFAEFKACIETINYLHGILSSDKKLIGIIKDELIEIEENFKQPRRTELSIDQHYNLDEIDLVAEEQVVITLSHLGYIKRQQLIVYTTQKRGGKGKAATSLKEEDIIKQMLVANTHDMLLLFTTHGRVYWLKAYKVPSVSRTARGKPVVNFLDLNQGEEIATILNVSDFAQPLNVFMATSLGVVKKTALNAFSRPRNSGIKAIEMIDGERLIGVELTTGEQEIMLFASSGKAIRFNENQIRTMGRTSRGVRGIRLKENQKLIALNVVGNEEQQVLSVSERGYGKCTKFKDYRITARGGQGVMSMQQTEKTGSLIHAIQVTKDQDIMLITNKGTLVRTPAKQISTLRRKTQGVRLIKVASDEQVIAIEAIEVEA